MVRRPQKKETTNKAAQRIREIVRNNRGTPEVEALFKQGQAKMNEGKLAEAAEIFTQVLRLKNDHIPTIEHMAVTAQQLGRLDTTELFFKALLEIAPDYTRAYGFLGKYYLSQQNVDQAMHYLNIGYGIAPDDSEVLSALASAYYKKGDSETADKYYRLAYECEQSTVNLIQWMKYTHKVRDKNDPAYKTLKQRIKQIEKDNSYEKVPAYLSLAKAEQQLKNHDESFIYTDKAMKLVRARTAFDIRNEEQMFKAIRTYFTPDTIKAAKNGNDSPAPVFIVGMPRSGSTLLEQMLDSHPDICGVGEAGHLTGLLMNKVDLGPNAENMAYPFAPRTLAGKPYDIPQLADDYLRLLKSHNTGNTAPQRYVDKQLANFRWIGVIAMAFPNAKIIHAKRHPLDCCLSCYQQDFHGAGQKFSYDLRELGAYYRLYDDLMAYWHEILPGKILDVTYEDVVQDTAAQLRRVLDYIGLPYDERCLEFHKNQRFVFTSSAGQINQPIYKSAVAKWKNYEKYLAPLVEAMGPAAPEDALYLLEKQGVTDN